MVDPTLGHSWPPLLCGGIQGDLWKVAAPCQICKGETPLPLWGVQLGAVGLTPWRQEAAMKQE